MRALGHGAIFVLLTLLTQLGGLAWLAALGFRRRMFAFALAYSAILLAAQIMAPAFGRQALPCLGDTLRSQSPAYCLMLRNFVTPDLANAARRAADTVAAEHPGTVTLTLDAGFPFVTGMPLLPHLSHDDGEKLDLAFFYQDASGYLPGKTRSPIGYWAFEGNDDAGCPPVWLTTRWNLGALQPLWPDRMLEPARTKTLMRALLADPAVAKVFLEPPLAAALGLSDAKLRFQGCRAARHDDHIHIQL